MTRLEVAVTEEEAEFVERRAAETGHGSGSHYIAELIRLDRLRTTGATIDSLLLEGLNSGEPFEVTDEWWARKKEELRSRATEVAR